MSGPEVAAFLTQLGLRARAFDFEPTPGPVGPVAHVRQGAGPAVGRPSPGALDDRRDGYRALVQLPEELKRQYPRAGTSQRPAL